MKTMYNKISGLFLREHKALLVFPGPFQTD